jgi:hypothetical protein
MPTLHFKGKNIIWNHHLSIPYHTLEEVSKLNFQADKGDGNLIIELVKRIIKMFNGDRNALILDFSLKVFKGFD